MTSDGFTFKKFQECVAYLESMEREQGLTPDEWAKMMNKGINQFFTAELRISVNDALKKYGYDKPRQWILTKDEKLKWY